MNLTVCFNYVSHTVSPVIEEDPSAEGVLAPNTASLTCIAAGEPSPDVVWVKEGTGGTLTELSESGNGVIIDVIKATSMSIGALTINSTDTFDTANYSCIARNFFGNVTSMPAEVTVFGES